MSDSNLHGGQIWEAARRFGCAPETFIDFSSNMNVLAPPIAAEDWTRWREETARYPEDADLRERLAEVYAIPASQLLPTAGAIEAIYFAARLFTGKRVAILEPCFSEYFRAFEATGARTERRLLNNVFDEDFSEFDAVVVCNPNNPTGDFFPAHKLLALKTHALLADEAFIEFSDETESLLPALPARPDVIVFRSLTKSWRIPGLRLGFLATANFESLARLRAMQPPWSINSITAAWARSYLTREHYSLVCQSLRGLPQLREKFRERLAQIPGIKAHPSAANFFLIELTAPQLDAPSLFEALARRGFLVRVGDSFDGLTPGKFLRVAVRTAEENNLFADALERVVVALLRSPRDEGGLDFARTSEQKNFIPPPQSKLSPGRFAEAPLQR